MGKNDLYDYERGKDAGRRDGYGLLSGVGESDAYREGRRAGAAEKERLEREAALEQERQARKEHEDYLARLVNEERKERIEEQREGRADSMMDDLKTAHFLEKKRREEEDALLQKLKSQRPDDPEATKLELQIMLRRSKFDDDWDERFEEAQAVRRELD